jgi:pyruvate kinase
LRLTRSQEPGSPAATDPAEKVLAPARIPCNPPEALGWVEVGERIWFDDGRIGGVVDDVDPDAVTVRITMARPTGERLGAGKGINLPDTTLHLPPLLDQDLEDLDFIVRHADLVGYSFVRSAADVVELQDRLAEIGGTQLGIVLKIETRAAYEDLPAVLLAALRSPVVGVMIARGDLAVECGFAHLAEVQEEILWMCEAAHVPVVWATQVLEQLAKDGRPSRAEVTDAAMAERAECVMLNKGPYIREALRALDSILKRMQAHQDKKRPLLRPMEIARRFFATRSGGRR